jgi:hypothetical protein
MRLPAEHRLRSGFRDETISADLEDALADALTS